MPDLSPIDDAAERASAARITAAQGEPLANIGRAGYRTRIRRAQPGDAVYRRASTVHGPVNDDDGEAVARIIQGFGYTGRAGHRIRIRRAQPGEAGYRRASTVHRTVLALFLTAALVPGTVFAVNALNDQPGHSTTADPVTRGIPITSDQESAAVSRAREFLTELYTPGQGIPDALGYYSGSGLLTEAEAAYVHSETLEQRADRDNRMREKLGPIRDGAPEGTLDAVRTIPIQVVGASLSDGLRDQVGHNIETVTVAIGGSGDFTLTFRPYYSAFEATDLSTMQLASGAERIPEQWATALEQYQQTEKLLGAAEIPAYRPAAKATALSPIHIGNRVVPVSVTARPSPGGPTSHPL